MAEQMPTEPSQGGDASAGTRAGAVARARAWLRARARRPEPDSRTAPVSTEAEQPATVGALSLGISALVARARGGSGEDDGAASPSAADARRWWPLPPIVAALVAVTIAVTFIAALTYWGARSFTSRAADTRASAEAHSFAQHSSTIATGDAFNGYIQILRYADDPVLANVASTDAERITAMQQLLFLNNNKFESLALVGRDGTIFAATDPAIADVRQSEAFNSTRADLGPANSDIVMPAAGQRGYVEYTAPLRAPNGEVWGILYGRADPEVLWANTLNATVDGSRNVIINSAGQFSTGVPDELLRQSWRGRPLDNGSVRADIAGVDSICGLGAIGRDTRIDHGWNVASCLPASLIQVEARRAMGDQGLITLAGAVLAVVLAAGFLRFSGFGTAPLPASALEAAPQSKPAPWPVEALFVPAEPEPVPQSEASEELPEPELLPEPEPQGPPVFVADVDALSIIDAYERRNAALAERLRESVQARLLVAAAQADEAYRLAVDEPERAAALHRQAMDEFEAVRDRDLRAVGQELHPALVRMGLPGALRALQHEFEGVLTIELDIDPAADGVVARGGRVRIDTQRRLVLFRVVRDGLRALADAGATSCRIVLIRDGDLLHLTIEADAAGQALDVPSLHAGSLAIRAFAGALSLSGDGGVMSIEVALPAPQTEEEEPEPEYEPAASWLDEDDPGAAVRYDDSDEPDDGGSAVPSTMDIHAGLSQLRQRLAGTIAIKITGERRNAADGLAADVRTAIVRGIEAVALAMASDGAPLADVRLERDGDTLIATVRASIGEHRFDASVLGAHKDVIDRDGFVNVNRHGDLVTVTIEVTVPDGSSARPSLSTPEFAAFVASVHHEQPHDEPDGSPHLLERLQAIAAAHKGTLAVTLDVAAEIDNADSPVDGALARDVAVLVEEALAALAGAEASTCLVKAELDGSELALRIEAPTAAPIDASALSAGRAAVQARHGSFAAAHDGATETIAARIAAIPAPAALLNVQTVTLDEDGVSVEPVEDGTQAI